MPTRLRGTPVAARDVPSKTMTKFTRVLVAILLLALLGAAGSAILVWWVGGSVGPVVIREMCSATVGGQTSSAHT